MTNQEFSDEFDILYNNIMSNQAPGLNGYEKSVFLTLAQESLILECYNSLSGESFETNEALKSYINSLVKQEINHSLTENPDGLPNKSYDATLPKDLWFIVYESVKVNDREELVVPITHDQYYKIYNNPFRGPSDKRVLRLTTVIDPAITDPNKDYPAKAELLCRKEDILNDYRIRYIAKPLPIILEDLSLYDTIDSNGNPIEARINGELGPKVCLLPEVLHRTILTRAVYIAKASWKA